MFNVGELLAKLSLDASQFTAGLETAREKLNNFSKKASELGRELTMFTAPLAAAGAYAVKMANDFNEAMAQVATMTSGGTERVIELKKEVQELSIRMGKSTRDMAGGLYQVLSAFGDTGDAIERLEIASKAATAGVSTTTDAINLLSAVAKGYGDTSTEMLRKISDLSFKTVVLGQTTFPELASSIGQVVPIASALGVSLEELFGVMATGTGVTGTASEVATQFRGILASFMSPSTQMANLMQKLGYSTGEAMIKSMGFRNALNAVVNEVKSGGGSLQDYLGRVEAITLALALTGGQADVFTQKTKAMYEAAGETDKAFKKVTEGVNKAGFTFAQLKTNVEVLAQQFGDAISPALLDFVHSAVEPALRLLTKLIQVYENMPAGLKKAFNVFSAIVIALGPVLFMFGKFASLLSTILGLLGVGGGAAAGGVSAGVAATGTSLIGLLGPVGLVIGALALLAGGIYLLYKRNKEFRKGVQDLGKVLWTIGVNIKSFFVNVFKSLPLAWKNLTDTFEKIKKKVKDFWKLLLGLGSISFRGITPPKIPPTGPTGGIGGIAKQILQKVGVSLVGVVSHSDIKDKVLGVIDKIRELKEEVELKLKPSIMLVNIEGAIEKAYEQVKKFFENAWEYTVDIIIELVKLGIKGLVAVWNAVLGVIRAIGEFIQPVWNFIVSIIVEIVSAVVTGYKWVEDEVKKAVSWIKEKIKALEIFLVNLVVEIVSVVVNSLQLLEDKIQETKNWILEKLQILKNFTVDVLVAIGGIVIDGLMWVLKKIEDTSSWVSKQLEMLKDFVVNVVISIIKVTIRGLEWVLKKVEDAKNWVETQVKSISKFVTDLVIEIMDVILRGLEWVEKKVLDTKNWVIEKIKQLESFVVDLWIDIKTVIIKGLDWVLKKIEDVKGFVLSQVETLKEFIVNTLITIQEVIITGLEWVIKKIDDTYNFISSLIDKIKSFIVNILVEIKNIVFEGLEPVLKVVQGAYDRVSNAVKTLEKFVVDIVVDIKSVVVSELKKVGDEIKKAKDWITEKLGDISSFVTDVVIAIGEVIISGLDWVKNEIKIAADSITGAAETIKEVTVQVVINVTAKLKQTAKKLQALFQEKYNEIGSYIRNTVEHTIKVIITAIPQILGLDNIKDKILGKIPSEINKTVRVNIDVQRNIYEDSRLLNDINNVQKEVQKQPWWQSIVDSLNKASDKTNKSLETFRDKFIQGAEKMYGKEFVDTMRNIAKRANPISIFSKEKPSMAQAYGTMALTLAAMPLMGEAWRQLLMPPRTGNLIVKDFSAFQNTTFKGTEQWVASIILLFLLLQDELVGHSIVPDMLNAIQRWFKKSLGGTVKENEKAYEEIIWVWENPRVKKTFSGLVNWIKDRWSGLKKWWGDIFEEEPAKKPTARVSVPKPSKPSVSEESWVPVAYENPYPITDAIRYARQVSNVRDTLERVRKIEESIPEAIPIAFNIMDPIPQAKKVRDQLDRIMERETKEITIEVSALPVLDALMKLLENTVKNGLNSIANNFDEFITRVKNAFKFGLTDQINEYLKEAFSWGKKWIKGAGGEFVEVAKTTADKVNEVRDKAMNKLREGIDKIADLVIGLTDPVALVMDVLANLIDINPLIKGFTNLGNSFVNFVSAMISLTDPIGFLGSVVSELLSNLNPLNALLGKMKSVLEPTFDALLYPVVYAGQVIGQALIPVLQALFPAFKQMGIMALSLAKMFGQVWNVLVTVANWFGANLQQINLSAFDEAIQNLTNMTWDQAEAAANAAEAMRELTNVPEGFKVELAEFTAMAGQSLASSAIKGMSKNSGDTYQSSYSEGDVIIENVYITSNDPEQIWNELKSIIQRERMTRAGAIAPVV